MVPPCLCTPKRWDRVGRRKSVHYTLIDPHVTTEGTFLSFCGGVILQSKLDRFVWSRPRPSLGKDATLSQCRFKCIFVSLCAAYSRSPSVLLDILLITAASSRSMHFHLCPHPANPTSNARVRKSKVCQGKMCNWRNVSCMWNLMHRSAVSDMNHSMVEQEVSQTGTTRASFLLVPLSDNS